MASIKWSSFFIGALVVFLLMYVMKGRRRASA